MSITKFSDAVIEKIGFYVYLLIDPRDSEKKVFYVGKGTGNRVFDHINDAIEWDGSTEKLDIIRAIIGAGYEVEYQILRHGLTEKEAFEVEAALIDYIGMTNLANIVQGHHRDERGKMNVVDIIARYDAEEINITEPTILITVNQYYEQGMSADDLYNNTRGNWVLGERREKAKYAMAVYRGIVRQVYVIESWHSIFTPDTHQKQRNRWYFEGHIAQELQHFVGGSVAHYITQGAQNPIKYVNM